MASAPVAVIDPLNSLLEAEINSVFRYMGEGSPYLSEATADVRKPLVDILEANKRHSRDLVEMIEAIGGTAVAQERIQPEEQYLAYLSLKFLIPKLVHSKELTLKRYENTIRSIEPIAPAFVTERLRQQYAECQAQLQILRQKADDVVAASRR